MQSLIQGQLLIRYRHKHATYWVDVIIPQMDPTMPSPTSVPTEPNPNSWLTDERRQQLIKDMSSSRPLLQQAGMWRAFLGYWVRWQASLEAKWPKDEEEICLDRLTKNGMKQIRITKRG